MQCLMGRANVGIEPFCVCDVLGNVVAKFVQDRYPLSQSHKGYDGLRSSVLPPVIDG